MAIRTNIYKKTHRSGNITWVVRWKDPASGKWRVMAGGRTKDEALIIEGVVRRELYGGGDPGRISDKKTKDITLNELLDKFYRTSVFLGGKEYWRREAKSKIENDIRTHLGNRLFCDLNQNTLFGFYLKLKERGISNRTVDKYHYLLSMIGDLYEGLSKSNINPIRKFKGYRKQFPHEESTRDINFLIPEEIDLLLKEARKSENKLLYSFIMFIAFTGLRRSEAVNLRWTDIDKKSGFIHVRKSKRLRSRIIPLEKEAWLAIKVLIGNGEYVFSNEDGTCYHKDSFLKPLQKAAKRAGISKRVDNHTLRHSYGSNKIRAGWGLKKVSMILGHADINTTSNIYTHLLDGDLKVRDELIFDFDKTESKNHSKNKQALGSGVDFSDLLHTKDGSELVAGVVKVMMKSLMSEMINNKDVAEIMSFVKNGKKGSIDESHVHRSSVEKEIDSLMKKNEIDNLSMKSNSLDAALMEPMSGLEPEAYALRKRCSTN